MFDIANWPSICANHTAGFSGEKSGTWIPTQLITKVESGGCSGRVDGSASCCMITSGSPMWWYKCEFPDTHNTHAQLYVHATLLLQPAACLLLHGTRVTHTHTDPLCSCHSTRNSVLMFIILRCMNDRISWLGGSVSQWRPPTAEIQAYPGLWSAVACLPQHLCYRPAVFFRLLRLVALSFLRVKFGVRFKNNISGFLLFFKIAWFGVCLYIGLWTDSIVKWNTNKRN